MVFGSASKEISRASVLAAELVAQEIFDVKADRWLALSKAYNSKILIRNTEISF